MAEQKISIIMELVDKTSAALKNISIQAKALSVGAIALLTAAVYKGTEAFSEQEKASASLAAAMKNGGVYTKQAQKAIEDYSTALSRSTVYADESITAASAIFAAYGTNIEQTNALAEAAANLATAKGMDIETSADMINKSIQNGVAIRSVSLEITGAAGSTERLNSTVKALSDTFGGRAQAEAQTFQGSMKQLSNAIGELFEAIGAIIAPAIQKIAEGLTSLTNYFLGLNPAIQTAILVTAGLAVGFLALVPVIISVGAALGILAGATATFGAVAAIVFSPITLTVIAIGAAVAFAAAQIMNLVHFLKRDANDAMDELNKKGDEIAQKGEENRAKKIQQQQDDAALQAEQEQAIREEADARLLEWDLSQDERRAIILQKEIDLENAKGTAADQAALKRLNLEKATTDLRIKLQADNAQKWATYEDFMAQATTSRNKEVAAIAKAISIKNIIQKTAEAAMEGYKSGMAWGGPAGPVLGGILAAAAIAFGAEQVGQVQALADGGSFIADQPTRGNIGGQPILFGEAGAEQVKFEPLNNSGDSGSGQSVIILTDDGTELCKGIWKKSKELETKGVLQ